MAGGGMWKEMDTIIKRKCSLGLVGHGAIISLHVFHREE